MSSASHPVVFNTQTQYPLPSQKFMIPTTWKRYQLSQLVNKALSLPKPVPFDFLLRGEILRNTIGAWCLEKGVGEEETLEIEYIESVLPPQRISEQPHEDWVSSVSAQLQGHFVTASYDGLVRVFDYSQNLVYNAQAHAAPITSLCTIPTTALSNTYLIATASHDLTAKLTQITLNSETSNTSQGVALATLHLHTSPLSSISSNSSGSHLLTSSWDSLIGLWDATIPSHDEVLVEQVKSEERKKRRKIDDTNRPKRKAPTTVLKSHASRVSKVVFGKNGEQTAYSCGFDSTVRAWDINLGICTQTINAPEKPMLDLVLNSDGQTALAASTDRTVSMYDLRGSTTATSSAVASLVHPATPSCLSTPSLGSSHQVVSGAYDGVVRLWDLRSIKSPIASFKTWDGAKKVLSADWMKGLVGVGGEGGLEVWNIGDREASS